MALGLIGIGGSGGGLFGSGAASKAFSQLPTPTNALRPTIDAIPNITPAQHLANAAGLSNTDLLTLAAGAGGFMGSGPTLSANGGATGSGITPQQLSGLIESGAAGDTYSVLGGLPGMAGPGGFDAAGSAGLGLTGGAAGGAAGGLSSTLSGLANNPFVKMGMQALPAVIGAIGSKQQADKQDKLAKEYLALGEPSRQRYEASFQPGFSMGQDPGFQDALNQAAKANLHALSVQGNPAGSPNAWNQTLTDVFQRFAYPALQNYRNMNSNAGGISNLQTSVPQIAMNSINSEKGIWDAVGAGAADIFNPPRRMTLKDLMNMQIG